MGLFLMLQRQYHVNFFTLRFSHFHNLSQMHLFLLEFTFFILLSLSSSIQLTNQTDFSFFLSLIPTTEVTTCPDYDFVYFDI
jgi:hypothetical protein